MKNTAKATVTDKLDLKRVIAMGVGAMVGGGIFSVLGLAIAQAGHAAPIAFALGGIIALLTGWSYSQLGLTFRSDGGSFTYLERAFGHGNVAGIGGWLLLVGYIGTMGLYAYTFGIYATILLGGVADHHTLMPHLLSSLVLLVFLAINLYGVKETGSTELFIVTIKVLILFLFAGIGLFFIKRDYVLPVFNNGHLGVFMGAALIFVAYEGFELITNTISEMNDPEHDLTRGILYSIGITIAIYVLVSLVAVGNLLPEEIDHYQEYALAVAAKPFLGNAGFILIGLAALFSTASAINATLFGTARLGAEMARAKQLPMAFGLRRRQNNIPWVSLVVITAITLVFVNSANLTIISSFASSTFLLIFAAINLSAWCLRKQIGIRSWLPLAGLVLSFSSWVTLYVYLWNYQTGTLIWLGLFYASIIMAELFFSPRRWIFPSG